MKKLFVFLRDERGKESVVATEAMSDEEAESLRERVEHEHASTPAGENRWIRVGDDSVQSKHVVRLQLQDATPREPEVWGEESEPYFTRDMQF